MTTADDPHNGNVPGPPFLTTEELRRDVSALREILQARLDGMDRAAVVLADTVNRTPTAIQTAIAHLKELHDERFASVALQFKERDERSGQLAKTQAEALEAALRAAKELNAAQGEANKEANAKTEVSFGQQIKAIEDKLEVINRRLDTGEGTTNGTASYRAERREDDKYRQSDRAAVAAQARATVSISIAAVSALITLTAVLYAVIHG